MCIVVLGSMVIRHLHIESIVGDEDSIHSVSLAALVLGILALILMVLVASASVSTLYLSLTLIGVISFWTVRAKLFLFF